MSDDIKAYLEEFEELTIQRFSLLENLIYTTTANNIQQKLWAKIPSFYVNSNFVRLIPFKDHINIEAKAIAFHRDELTDYKITSKGMLQIFHNQMIPCEVLTTIFEESLDENK